MATLEKIRSKSGLLIIVIGLALLAFIVGDALTNSRNLFGDHTTVAKVGGEKIDYTEYQRKREELNNQLETARKQNPAQYANFDTQLLAQMAIEQLVGEHLLDRAVDKAGIRPGSETLRFYIFDNPVNTQRLSEIIQQLNAQNLNVTTPQQAHEVIFNPKQHGLTDADMAPFQRAWIAMEQETKNLVARQTYQRLLYGTVKANELDKKALFNDYVSTRTVDLVVLPYGQLDEKKYPVSDAEAKAVYDQDKNRFKVQEPTKDVSFISVNIVPSDADRAESKRLSAEALKSLSDSAGGQVSKDLRKSGVVVERRALRASDINAGRVKDFVLSAAPGAVQVIDDNIQGFTIVKMAGHKTEIDSIQLNIVQVVGKTLPGRVLAALNGGLPADSVAKRFSADSVMAQTEQWIPLFSAQGKTGALQDAQLDSLNAAGSRYITLMSTDEGAILAQVSKRNAPVSVYEYDEVTYDLKPSTKTVDDARVKLEKFLAANKTAADFNKNASKEGYNVQKFSLNQSSPAVPRMMGMQSYYPDSRQVVRWVMIDGKPGEVSHVYESKDTDRPALYAVAVDAEYDEYIPVSNDEVKKYVTDKARRSKAGDDLVKKYTPSAKSVAGAAQAMGVEASQPKVRMARTGAIRDPKVLGQILGAKPGAKTVIVKGDDGVYVYCVVSEETEKFPYNAQQYEQQYFQLVNPQLQEMLRGADKIVNNAYKFEAGD